MVDIFNNGLEISLAGSILTSGAVADRNPLPYLSLNRSYSTYKEPQILLHYYGNGSSSLHLITGWLISCYSCKCYDFSQSSITVIGKAEAGIETFALKPKPILRTSQVGPAYVWLVWFRFHVSNCCRNWLSSSSHAVRLSSLFKPTQLFQPQISSSHSIICT